MDKHKIVSDIESHILELGSSHTLFLGTVTGRFEGFVTLDKINIKITSIKRLYYIYLGLSIVLGGLLYIAGFAQIFNFTLVDFSKSGLLIVLAVADIFITIRYRIDLERIKMIKHLLGLKLMIEQE